MIKLCYKCQKNKDVSCFGKKASTPDGLQPMCKECRSQHDNLHRFQPSVVRLTDCSSRGDQDRKIKKRRKIVKAAIDETMEEKSEIINKIYKLEDEVIIKHLFSIYHNMMARMDQIEKVAYQQILTLNRLLEKEKKDTRTE